METVASHLDVLRDRKFETVFEFGMGYNSTGYFINECRTVVSVEMQNEEWFDKVIERYGDRKGFIPLYQPGPRAAIDTLKSSHRFDLVFVDGHGKTRPEAVMEGFKHSNLVIAHDTEQSSYGWSRIVVPEGWEVIKHTPVGLPHTTEWIKNV